MAKSVISASVVKIVKLALLCKLGTYGRLVYMKIELYALHRTAVLPDVAIYRQTGDF